MQESEYVENVGSVWSKNKKHFQLSIFYQVDNGWKKNQFLLMKISNLFKFSIFCLEVSGKINQNIYHLSYVHPATSEALNQAL